jgi:hypothetical protein
MTPCQTCTTFSKKDLEILEDCCRFTKACTAPYNLTLFEDIEAVLSKINKLLHNGEANYSPV